MSCCGGKCSCCASGCGCGNGCGGCNKNSAEVSTQTMIYTMAPLKGKFESFGSGTGSECGGPNCKCGANCSRDSCCCN